MEPTHKNRPSPLEKVVPTLSYLGLVYAASGFFNEVYIARLWPRWHIDSIFLSRFSEIFVIVGFGLYRLRVEKNAYTRRRILALILFMASLWGVIPLFFPFHEPHVGLVPFSIEFPGVHVPGALTYFVWLTLIFFFGRRVDCGWCCPCVGIRETAGAPFRKATIKGGTAWRLRHIQWIFAAFHVIYLVLIFLPSHPFAATFFTLFWTIIPLGYYVSFLVIPWTGNRNFCRYLCPFGSVYGAVSVAGFYRIDANPALCHQCGRCDRDCDMGVPVSVLVREKGVINDSSCTGCGRCVSGCPNRVLSFRDVRDVFRRDDESKQR